MTDNKIILGGLGLISNCNNEVKRIKRGIFYKSYPYTKFEIPSPPYLETNNIKCKPLYDIGINYDKLKDKIDSNSIKYISSGTFNHAYDISYENDDGKNKDLVMRIMKDTTEYMIGRRRKLIEVERLQISQMEQKGLMYQTLLCKSKKEGGYECPNICHVYDFGIYKVNAKKTAKKIFEAIPKEHTNDFRRNGVYAILEKLGGGELRDRIRKHKYTIQEIRILSRNILESLSYMHSKGIVHLDLKPENIMMVSEDNHTDIKLIDFGMSASRDKGRIINIEGPRGTPGYISPNIVDKSSILNRSSISDMSCSVDGRDDIWSFAITLVEIATRQGIPSVLQEFIKSGNAFTLKPTESTWEKLKKEMNTEKNEDINEFIEFLKSIFEPGGTQFMGRTNIMHEMQFTYEDRSAWYKIPSAKALLNSDFLKEKTEKSISVKDIKLSSIRKGKKSGSMVRKSSVKDSKLSGGKNLKKSRRKARK